MGFKLLCMIFLILLASWVEAIADDDNFTQMGTVQANLSSNGAQVPTFNWQVPNVTFPQEFGSPPQVITSFSTLVPVAFPPTTHAPPNFLSVAPENITSTGFTPVISARGAMGPGPVTISWMALGSKLYTGTATAKYLVLTVIYAPPGTDGGKSSSSVSYGSGSSTGTTTSASQSFQQSYGISVKTEAGGILGSGGSGSLSFDYSNTSTDSQSLDIKQSTTSTILRNGPAQDGINHDEDAIYLLLKPQLNLSLSSSAASWAFGDNSQSPIQYVFVGELDGHYPWRAGVLAELNSAGITASDYSNILASDPLASGETILDPVRFVPANTMFPYEAPATPNDPVIPITTVISSSSTTTQGSISENSYKVGLSISGSAGFLGLAKTTLTNTDSWEWKNSSSATASVGTSQTASLTIGGPAYGYNGATEVAVYTDTIYHTFAFVLVPPSDLEISVKGTVFSRSGRRVPRTEVTLTQGGIKYSTFTNSRGEYAFFGPSNGPTTVQAAGFTQIIPQLQAPKLINLNGPKLKQHAPKPLPRLPICPTPP